MGAGEGRTEESRGEIAIDQDSCCMESMERSYLRDSRMWCDVVTWASLSARMMMRNSEHTP